MQYLQMGNLILVVVIDCNDLDNQLFGVFVGVVELLWEMFLQVDIWFKLCELLGNWFLGGIIFIIIQKFMLGEDEDSFLVFFECYNIVVICDEVY